MNFIKYFFKAVLIKLPFLFFMIFGIFNSKIQAEVFLKLSKCCREISE